MTAEDQKQENSVYRTLLIKSFIAAILGVPLFVLDMIGITHVQPGWDQAFWIPLSIVVFFIMWYSGGHFFSGAWKSFKAHKANMNTLIAVATGPAWLYSMIVAIWPGIFPELARSVYLDTPMLVIALIVFGSALEMRATEKASSNVNKLLGLIPNKVNIINKGKDKEIAYSELQQGMTVTVEPNQVIPVDGKILVGKSKINEFNITNKKEEVEKQAGDKVNAGTMNIANKLLIKVQAIGEDTALLKLVDLVKQAQHSKPSIGKLADKIAYYFAPAVIIIALITLAVWFNFGPAPQIAYMLVTFMAVLLIACPCALGLAAPISITAGVSKAADIGIYFRNADVLQNACKIKYMFIDKTVKQDKAMVDMLHKLGVKTYLNYLREDVAKVRKNQAKGLVGFIGEPKECETLIDLVDISFGVGSSAYHNSKIDAVIMDGSLYSLVDAIRISKATMRNIKQNLSGAFIYNTAGIPIAAGVFYPLVGALLSPIIAGALMACSSLGVVTNANRLFLLKKVKRG